MSEDYDALAEAYATCAKIPPAPVLLESVRQLKNEGFCGEGVYVLFHKIIRQNKG